MKVAYADPPYPGQAKKHYGKHSDYAGEVDHRALVDRLEAEYPDGWALSTGSKNLQEVLALCPPVRVLIWNKRAGIPLGDHFYWQWEPVLLRGCRRPLGYPHDFIEVIEALPQGYTFTFRDTPDKHVTGAKPEAFSFWLFECMGLRPDDEFHDLFPGSGAVTNAWESWRTNPPTKQEAATAPPEGSSR